MADTFERVMVIVAHPDDAESWVGGTVAKLTREGRPARGARREQRNHEANWVRIT